MNKKIVIIVLAALLVAAGAFAIVNRSADQAKDVQVQAQAPAQEEGQATQTHEGQADQEPEMQTAQGGEEAQILEMSGAVTELGEEYFIVQDAVLGEVQINFSDDTMFDGIQADELAVGQIALVLYDGKMTRSLPPQAYALRVGVYAVSGTVTEVSQESMTIIREEIGDEVIVFLPDGVTGIAAGDKVTAYTNGAMTMSLPAQTTALGVVMQ